MQETEILPDLFPATGGGDGILEDEVCARRDTIGGVNMLPDVVSY